MCQTFIGGWKTLKRIVQELLTVSQEDSELDDEDKFVQSYLSLLAEENNGMVIAEALAGFVQDYGWERWRKLVTRTSYKVRLLLVGAMFAPALNSTEAG